SHGSGAVIRRDGYILTSTHVIEGADEIVVTMHDGREFEAELVQADQRSDLAVIKIEAQNLRPVRLGDLSRVRQGQWCFVVGNPFGLSNTSGKPALTYGIVSALGRDLNDELNAEDLAEAERRYYGNLIQTSAAINPGNSGGPLFNINGEMTGVVIAIASRSGVNEGTGFAIPVTRRTREIIDLLRRGEQVQYGYLGVEVSDNRAGRRITGDHQAPGAVISGLGSTGARGTGHAGGQERRGGLPAERHPADRPGDSGRPADQPSCARRRQPRREAAHLPLAWSLAGGTHRRHPGAGRPDP
ncbi:MAG: S1C family serine protease, partial [Planctomycetota bacterium]